MPQPLQFKLVKPDTSLADFVYCFTSLQNLPYAGDAVIIPNGKIDLIFSKDADGMLRTGLMGLETRPKQVTQAVAGFFAVSFNPLAVEYVLRRPVAGLLNSGTLLPAGFWDFCAGDLDDFDVFCEKASRKIQSLLPAVVDDRKRALFQLIAASDGEIPVKTLSETVFWSERQINRYFNQQFGLSLKAYCSILRFQASLPHIKKGELYPQLNFTDQSHFIKEVKKNAGVSPKELYRNENDRFLQFLAYREE